MHKQPNCLRPVGWPAERRREAGVRRQQQHGRSAGRGLARRGCVGRLGTTGEQLGGLYGLCGAALLRVLNCVILQNRRCVGM